MDNSSLPKSNMTQVSDPSNKLIEYVKWTLIFLLVVGYVFFTCFFSLILNAFFMTPHLRDNPRYVLFVYMLTNDTYYLYSGFYFLLATIYKLLVPVPLCFVLHSLSNIVFQVTPYILAAMAVEQYVAICHPLRHAELCTTYRAHVTFTTICSLLVIPQSVELFVMISSKTNIFNLYIICRQTFLTVDPFQPVLRSISLILCFTSVGLVIFVTYVKIILVAHKISSGSSTASKAGKTVILHAFQLLLCMASLLSKSTEAFQIKQAELLPIFSFFVFLCFPRYLSPVIYGIRDEVLRKHVKMSLLRLSHSFYDKN